VILILFKQNTMQFTFPESGSVEFRAWKKSNLPKKILFIRLHAFGDMLAAMPAVQHLKELLPNVEMHMLVCAQYADLPMNMTAFSKVHTLKHARGGWEMAFDLLAIYPSLLLERFDAVIDVQNNIFSRTARKALFPTAWTQFDRYSKIHVVRRYQNTVNALGIATTDIGRKVALRDETSGLEKLQTHGWNGKDKLIVLNPCGMFPTRQWGIEKYLAFARLWLEKVEKNTKFVLLGYDTMHEKTLLLQKELGNHCINLIGKTSVLEVFNIVRNVHLTLSDDGGLLHVSWINHVPTIGFLGASPSYWGIPLGEKSYGFTSDDLPCGNCHRTDCIWGDNRCLTRVTLEMALNQAIKLLGLETKPEIF
jgi:heptosyltransferase II